MNFMSPEQEEEAVDLQHNSNNGPANQDHAHAPQEETGGLHLVLLKEEAKRPFQPDDKGQPGNEENLQEEEEEKNELLQDPRQGPRPFKHQTPGESVSHGAIGTFFRAVPPVWDSRVCCLRPVEPPQPSQVGWRPSLDRRTTGISEETERSKGHVKANTDCTDLLNTEGLSQGSDGDHLEPVTTCRLKELFKHRRDTLTFPIARRALSKNRIIPKKRKNTPKPVSPIPISAEHTGKPGLRG